MNKRGYRKTVDKINKTKLTISINFIFLRKKNKIQILKSRNNRVYVTTNLVVKNGIL